ncbi:MAG TPA: glycosyl hydrolase family 65 protein [Actinomycetota bacterium]|nr:glycosyl hydrolase family 65 protein [Actinomycetota bacterium]
MTTSRRTVGSRPSDSQPDRRFEAVVFDWDGTAVPDRGADATGVRDVVEGLSGLGMDVAVVSGTHVENIDGQLRARPSGPGRLHLCLNRGSEVFVVDSVGPRCVYRRVASPAEDAALTAAAELVVDRLRARGLDARIVSARLNRRKIDLIPEPEWSDPPKARIEELLLAVEERLHRCGFDGLPEVAAAAEVAAAEVGLSDARVTSDAKHVEIGLTDKSDSARWILDDLWRRGIGPGLVLIIGDEMGSLGGLPGSDSLMLVPEARRSTAVSVGVEPAGVLPGVIWLGGGPATFLSLLEDQLRRRAQGSVPQLDEDPAWILTVEGLDPQLERVHEALLTIADGRIGTSGSPLGAHPSATPAVLAAGLYDGEGPEEQLLPGPVWNQLPIDLDSGIVVRRMLDLRTGVLRHEMDTAAGPMHAVSLSSLSRPGCVVLRVQGPPRPLVPGPSLVPPPGRDVEVGETDGTDWMRVGGSHGGVVAVAIDTERRDRVECLTLDRLGAYEPDSDGKSSLDAALRSLGEAGRRGFDHLLVDHRAAWGGRWEQAEVVIEGDPELQKAIRFALFHLMASVADSEEASVGARGLTGPGYRGHVFWDSDVFVLPFVAATHPRSARAMLEYRIRRLPAAREAAVAAGCAGARFPWESAGTGVDVTPRLARDHTGRARAIRTGQQEEHVVADVVWAAACYLDWSGDQAFASGPGRELLVETARYWASRIRRDEKGRGHIYGVIGPDEYHETVDDDAFTNVMARWNLRRAARVVTDDPGESMRGEAGRWLELADSLVDGFDPNTGLYEQFAGFFELEPLVIRDLARRRPVAADLLLGAERVRGAQVIKQADVLMLHHMVPDEVAPGSLVPNLDFYEPRTAHGSSLSPGVHAALFARVGRLEEAVDALRLAARIDLDDLTGTTASGLHLAAMGSVWQALAYGFAGIRPHGGVLQVDPRLPEAWSALEIPVLFRGRRIRVRVEPARATIEADGPAEIELPGVPVPTTVESAGVRLRRSREGWEVET